MAEIFTSGNIIIAIIVILSVLGVSIIIERLRFFRRSRADEDRLMERIRHSLEKGHYDEALSICDQNPSPLSDLMRVGLEYRHYSPEVIHDLVSDAANLEVPRMEKNITLLGTIAHITPLLGLLGTVTGNIQAFGVLSDFGAGADPALLAGGIAEALITTAAGIIAAIPAIVFYNQLVSMVNHNIIRLENRVNELVVLLKGDTAPPVPSLRSGSGSRPLSPPAERQGTGGNPAGGSFTDGSPAQRSPGAAAPGTTRPVPGQAAGRPAGSRPAPGRQPDSGTPGAQREPGSGTSGAPETPGARRPDKDGGAS